MPDISISLNHENADSLQDDSVIQTLLAWCEEAAECDPAGFADLIKEYNNLEEIGDIKVNILLKDLSTLLLSPG